MKNLTEKQMAVAGLALLSFVTMAPAAGTSSAQFLKLGAGARAAGMGDAFCSVADDANATYWNPAGLAQVKSAELSLLQNSYLQETDYQYVAGALPISNGTVGAFVQRLDLGTIDRYTAADAKDGSFDAGSMAAGVSFGKEIRENMMLGFTAKYIKESIEAESASSFGGDFGMLYKSNLATYGFAIQHLGAGMKMVTESAPLPLTLRGGASKRFLQDRLLAAVEISKANDSDAAIHLGTEYRINKILAVRGGYKGGKSLGVDGLTAINGGIGLNLNRFSFDYSISPFGDLGIAHRLSLLVKFSSSN